MQTMQTMQTMQGSRGAAPARAGAATHAAAKIQLRSRADTTSGAGRPKSVPAAAASRGAAEAERGDGPALQKRGLLLALAAAAAAPAAWRPPPAAAAEAYTDPRDSFSIALPEGWTLREQAASQGTGPTAVSRTLTWLDEADPSVFVTAKISNIGADYTSLGSLGNAEQFGASLVASMDQSFLKRAPAWARPKGGQLQEAQLVRASAGPSKYTIEYTVQRSEDDRRHLLSAVAIGYNGRFMRLFTVTAQCPEAAFPQQKGRLQAVLDSFEPPQASY